MSEWWVKWWICTVFWGLILTLKQFLQEVFIQRWRCMCVIKVILEMCVTCFFGAGIEIQGVVLLSESGWACILRDSLLGREEAEEGWDGGWEQTSQQFVRTLGGGASVRCSDLLSSKDFELFSDTDQTLKLWSWAGWIQRSEWDITYFQLGWVAPVCPPGNIHTWYLSTWRLSGIPPPPPPAGLTASPLSCCAKCFYTCPWRSWRWDTSSHNTIITCPSQLDSHQYGHTFHNV